LGRNSIPLSLDQVSTILDTLVFTRETLMQGYRTNHVPPPYPKVLKIDSLVEILNSYEEKMEKE
jgi:hypothetical protein